VTGRPEIWQTIQQVLELLWSGGDEGDTDGGLGTAQQILDAADITIPTGDLATGGVYDSLGAHYSLPEYVVSDPENIAELSARNSNEDKSGEEAEDNLDADEILRRRQEKGKAVVNADDLINIRVKVSDREETPLKVTISKEDNARIVALKILEEAGVRFPSHPRDLKLIV
jgi:Ubiquitin-binding domain